MRSLAYISLAALMLASAPVIAEDGSAPEIVFVEGTGTEGADAPIASPVVDTGASEKMTKFAQRLDDPAMQDSIAAMVEGMSGMMLSLPVGKFAGAIEKARPGAVKDSIPDDATLADLAGPDAEAIPARLGDESRNLMSMMSGFAQAFAGMIPEFEAIARDIEESVKKARRK